MLLKKKKGNLLQNQKRTLTFQKSNSQPQDNVNFNDWKYTREILEM